MFKYISIILALLLAICAGERIEQHHYGWAAFDIFMCVVNMVNFYHDLWYPMDDKADEPTPLYVFTDRLLKEGEIPTSE